MSNKKIICDVCGALFVIDNIIVVDVREDKEKLSFMCPACRTEYEICVRDKSIQLPLVSRSK